MDLCRPRPGRNELGQEWKNNLNYVVQIVLPLLSQLIPAGSRSTQVHVRLPTILETKPMCILKIGLERKKAMLLVLRCV